MCGRPFLQSLDTAETLFTGKQHGAEINILVIYPVRIYDYTGNVVAANANAAAGAGAGTTITDEGNPTTSGVGGNVWFGVPVGGIVGHAGLWIALAAAALIILFIVLVRRRKDDDEQGVQQA